MQLKTRPVLIALSLSLLLSVAAGTAHAQSLTPMRKSGVTPSDVKGFRLTVGNPYSQRMIFDLVPMDPGFTVKAGGASVSPAALVLAPGVSRTVIFAFSIPAPQKERTIGLCVIPRNIEGPVLPRVCGTYTGTLLRP